MWSSKALIRRGLNVYSEQNLDPGWLSLIADSENWGTKHTPNNFQQVSPLTRQFKTSKWPIENKVTFSHKSFPQ